MKNTDKYLALLACLLMTFSCGTNEEPIEPTPANPPVPAEKGEASVVSLDIPLGNGTTTRAHWDAEGQFVWDAQQSLLTVVKHETAFVPFYPLDNTATQSQYHSLTDIEINTENPGQAKFKTQYGMLIQTKGDLVTYPVAVSDPVYNLSPTGDITSSANGVTASMPITNKFSQSVKDDMSALKDYAYIYAKTEISEVSKEAICAQGTTFDAGVALVRFSLKSTIEGNKVTKITMAADEGKRIFPNTATWTAGAESPISVSTDNTSFYNNVSTTIANEQGEALENGTVQNYYQLLLPCTQALTDDCLLTFTIETEKIDYTYSITTESFFAKSKNGTKTFEAGKIFTFGFTLGETVQLTEITFSTWGETVFDMEGELVSEVIYPEVTTWEETLLPAAQMEFVDLGLTKTVEGKNYKVLWATCNLGSLTPLGEGRLFAWGATNTDNDPVVRAYGLSGYNWMTPAKEDFEQLMSVGTPVFGTFSQTDVTAGGSEAQGVSAWKFTSTDGKIMYLPVTAYKVGDADPTKVQGVCHYWSGSGTAEAPLGFVTIYDNGKASLPSSLTEFTDSRLMAIRPIYLKPIK